MANSFDCKEKVLRPAWMPPTPVFEETPELGKDRPETADPRQAPAKSK
jgi:hypothetical protein